MLSMDECDLAVSLSCQIIHQTVCAVNIIRHDTVQIIRCEINSNSRDVAPHQFDDSRIVKIYACYYHSVTLAVPAMFGK